MALGVVFLFSVESVTAIWSAVMLKTRSGKIIGTLKVAQLLDVHPCTVRRKVADGTLPKPFRKPGSYHLAWFEADILKVIEKASEAA